jgi:hypothetical protein
MNLGVSVFGFSYPGRTDVLLISSEMCQWTDKGTISKESSGRRSRSRPARFRLMFCSIGCCNAKNVASIYYLNSLTMASLHVSTHISKAISRFLTIHDRTSSKLHGEDLTLLSEPNNTQTTTVFRLVGRSFFGGMMWPAKKTRIKYSNIIVNAQDFA